MEKDPEAEQTLFLRGAAQLREGVQVCGTRIDVKGTDLNGKRGSRAFLVSLRKQRIKILWEHTPGGGKQSRFWNESRSPSPKFRRC